MKIKQEGIVNISNFISPHIIIVLVVVALTCCSAW